MLQFANCWFPSKHVGRLVIIFHIGLFVVYMYNHMVWLTSGFTTKRYWTKTLTNERIVGSNTTNDSNYVVSLEAEGSSYENRIDVYRIGSFCGFSGHHKNRSLWRRIGNVGARWPLELSIPDLMESFAGLLQALVIRHACGETVRSLLVDICMNLIWVLMLTLSDQNNTCCVGSESAFVPIQATRLHVRNLYWRCGQE